MKDQPPEANVVAHTAERMQAGRITVLAAAALVALGVGGALTASGLHELHQAEGVSAANGDGAVWSAVKPFAEDANKTVEVGLGLDAAGALALIGCRLGVVLGRRRAAASNSNSTSIEPF